MSWTICEFNCPRVSGLVLHEPPDPLACPFHNRRRRGFTLIELIIVFVIIIIVAGVVSASMAGFLSRSRLNSTTARLTSMMIFARSQAITSGRQIEVDIDKSGGEIKLLQQSTDDPKQFDSVGEEWRIKLPEDITISDLKTDEEKAEEDSKIIFYPTGGAQAATVTLSLSSGTNMANENKRQLTINKVTGRVKLNEAANAQ